MKSQRARVGDVLTLERRSIDVDPTEQYEEIGVRSFGRGIFHKEPVSGADLGNKRVFRIEPGDLVVSNVFAWEGAIAVATEAEAGRIGSHRFMTFVATDGRIDTAWAAWFFKSETGLELIQRASPGSAGRNRTLAIERFENIEIPLPPLESQRAVANQLDSVRSNVDRASATLSDGAAHIISLLPDLTDEVLRCHSTASTPVSEIAEVISDVVHPGENPSPADRFVGLQHIEGHTGLAVGSDPLGPMKGRKFRYRPGDILYGYLRPYQNKVWVADSHGLCSVDQYVLRPHDGVNGDVLGYALRGRATLSTAIEKTHSLQLPRLRSGLLLAIEVPVIADSRAEHVVEVLDRIRCLTRGIADRRARQRETAFALLVSSLNSAFCAR